MKLTPPVCLPRNIFFAYTSAPFTDTDNIGWMVPDYNGTVDIAHIYVHPRLTEKQKLRISIHESLHAAYPDLTEKQVITGADIIADVVWKAGFRKI